MDGNQQSSASVSESKAWRWADLVFGIAAPVLCVIFDPAVFRSGPAGSGLLAGLQLFAYAEIVFGVSALGIHLITRRATPFLSGVLFAGFIFSSLLGLAILPLTILGLFIGIGVFGLMPFMTASVFYRRSRRVWKSSAISIGVRKAYLAAMAGVVLALLLPAALHIGARYASDKAIAEVISGSDAEATRSTKRLKTLHYVTSVDKLVWAYNDTKDEIQKNRLRTAYYEITGYDIEYRLGVLAD